LNEDTLRSNPCWKRQQSYTDSFTALSVEAWGDNGEINYEGNKIATKPRLPVLSATIETSRFNVLEHGRWGRGTVQR
jgi:hypothetical protein